MSQSRFWISNHPTYEEATAAKKKALEDKPEGVFQVRKSGTGFRLVERFKNNEATVIRNTKQRSRKKRASEDFSWVNQG